MTTRAGSRRVIEGALCLAAAATALAAAPAAPRFDGGRAYDHLRQVVSFGPRPAGSAALESTRAFIRRQLAADGIQVVEQPFDAETPVGRLHMVNLIARIPGASPDRLVFAGHYDTKRYREFRFVGANDAGSSTAFLIEWGRVVKARKNPLTIELLFLDGEEATLPEWDVTTSDHTYGSRHYVEAAKKDRTLGGLKAMILVDMIGDRDLRIMRETYSSPWLTGAIWAAARRLNLGEVFVDRATAIEDDHLPFLEAGVQAVDIIDLDYPPWHTAADTLDKVSARSLQVVGDVLLEALPAIERRAAARSGRAGS